MEKLNNLSALNWANLVVLAVVAVVVLVWLWRFIRRNRVEVAAVIVTSLLSFALVAYIVGFSWGVFRQAVVWTFSEYLNKCYRERAEKMRRGLQPPPEKL